jgi:hypothetical protein
VNTLLERSPSVESVTGGTKYCHIVCSCSMAFGLCGAYKPSICGISIDEIETGFCPVCRKPICKDCEDELDSPCIRCGVV